MQFQVPQFIDVEDKIIGPLTLKQFLYLAAAGAISFILFFTLETGIWVALSALLLIIAASLAFIRFNGRELPLMLFAALKYTWLPKFYLWKQVTPKKQKRMAQTLKIAPLPKPKRASFFKRKKSVVKRKPPIPTRRVAPKQKRANPLKSLFFKLKTHTKPIPKREKKLPNPEPKPEPVVQIEEPEQIVLEIEPIIDDEPKLPKSFLHPNQA